MNEDLRRTYGEVDTEHRRSSNRVRWETRNAVKLKEKNIAKHVKENPKLFWQYVQSKTRTQSRIPDLYKDDTKQDKTTNGTERSHGPLRKFSTVFIKKPE